jgi:hypothetical protein
MKPQSPLKLSRLRDIGWSEWDPIGLLAKGEPWKGVPFANEYDSYLLEAARRLGKDQSVEDAVEFLITIERDHMGLGTRSTTRTRAEATAKAIQSYLEIVEGHG